MKYLAVSPRMRNEMAEDQQGQHQSHVQGWENVLLLMSRSFKGIVSYFAVDSVRKVHTFAPCVSLG